MIYSLMYVGCCKGVAAVYIIVNFISCPSFKALVSAVSSGLWAEVPAGNGSSIVVTAALSYLSLLCTKLLLSLNQVSSASGNRVSFRLSAGCLGRDSGAVWSGASRSESGSNMAGFRAVGTWNIVLAGLKSRAAIGQVVV